MADIVPELTIKQRAVNAISSNRMDEGVYEPGRRYDAGCAFVTLGDVYKFYNPEKPVPRLFLTDPIKFAPKLDIGLPDFLDFNDKNKEALGFEVDQIIVDAARYGNFMQTPAFDALNSRKEKLYLEFDPSDYLENLYNSGNPLAIVCFDEKGNARHMESCSGSYDEKKAIMGELDECGYVTPIYVSFKRLNE